MGCDWTGLFTSELVPTVFQGRIGVIAAGFQVSIGVGITGFQIRIKGGNDLGREWVFDPTVFQAMTGMGVSNWLFFGQVARRFGLFLAVIARRRSFS
ncbi:hypothetical protein NRB16_19080 [Pseudomonas sp. LJDD11]|uniref:hypothetical protein n=1 Tax=Pseudomonas sp. LJDD11 TaxID=2931984 RepID=UPI00211CCF68|nr:hypothetical protein [Pseudomonas sp. LJDD11]MCQ9425625.1 hypothetical protein [Pseudomonas sp. LJDD11]